MTFIQQLRESNKGLFQFGLLFLALAAVFLGLSFIDSTQVSGVNRWYKPLKFSLSIWTYLWTLIIIFPYLPKTIFIQRARFVIILAMLVEIALIILQAARGVRSHFNNDTPFDIAVFAIMGVMIMSNTIIIAAFIVMILRNKSVKGDLKLAFAPALGALFIASAFGIWMSVINTNVLRPEVEGYVLPFFGWQFSALDLRVSHFIGIHGLQVIPLFAYFWTVNEWSSPKASILGFSVLYYGLILVPFAL